MFECIGFRAICEREPKIFATDTYAFVHDEDIKLGNIVFKEYRLPIRELFDPKHTLKIYILSVSFTITST